MVSLFNHIRILVVVLLLNTLIICAVGKIEGALIRTKWLSLIGLAFRVSKRLLLEDLNMGPFDGLRGRLFVFLLSCIFIIVKVVIMAWLKVCSIGTVLVRIKLRICWFQNIVWSERKLLNWCMICFSMDLTCWHSHYLLRRSHLIKGIVAGFTTWLLKMIVCSFIGLYIDGLVLLLRRRAIWEVLLWRSGLP